MTSLDETCDADAHFAQGFEFRKTGRPEEAIASYQKALTLYEALAKAHPTELKYQSDLANTHNAQGNLFLQMDHLDCYRQAEVSYQKALTIRAALAKADTTVTEYQSDLANTHYNMGILFRAIGRPEEAIASYQKALILYEALAKAHPTETEYQSDLANSHENLGIIFHATGRPEEAEVSFQDAEAIRAKIR